MEIQESSFEMLTAHVGIFHLPTNIGVVVDGGLLYLIDSGSGDDDGESLFLALRKIFPRKRIVAIINTHAHSDHCGADSFFVERTGCEVWAPEPDGFFIEHPSLVSDFYWGGRAFSDLHSRVFESSERCAVSKSIDNKKIKLDSTTIDCIPLPGHFLGQTGILVREKNCDESVFFLGDAFFGLSVLKKYWIPFMQDEVAFRNSIGKIERTSANFYVPSHGEVYTRRTIHAIAELNIMITYETEDLILKILRKKSLTEEQLLKEVADYAGINMKMSQIVLIGTTIRSYLSSLYDSSLVTYEVRDNLLVWKASPREVFSKKQQS